jgi:hypothetical protein
MDKLRKLIGSNTVMIRLYGMSCIVYKMNETISEILINVNIHLIV